MHPVAIQANIPGGGVLIGEPVDVVLPALDADYKSYIRSASVIGQIDISKE